MTGLVLKLSPGERLLINGAVVENGDRRAKLSVKTPNANILRLRDAIHPHETGTPVRRLCYSVQLVLSGDVKPENASQPTLHSIEELSHVFTDLDSRALLANATDAVLGENYYACLKNIRALIPRESRLMAAMS